MSESWGCEFTDDGDYGKLLSRSEDLFENDNLRFLPLEIVESALDKKYIAEIINKDMQYINELASSISSIGFKEPGVLTFDTQSIRLSDGNHRFIAAQILGLKKFPVILQEVDSLKASSGRISKFLNITLEIMWQHQN
jgi:hypothetical protein